MHEMAIAVTLVRQLELLAEEHGLVRIDEFTVAAGAARQIVPEALQMAFEAAASGTCAQEALIKFQVVPVVVQCRSCGERFGPQSSSFLCAGCGQADVEIVEGNDIVLASVTGRDAVCAAAHGEELGS